MICWFIRIYVTKEQIFLRDLKEENVAYFNASISFRITANTHISCMTNYAESF